MNDLERDNIEVRLHKDGTLDEIVIDDPYTGRCLFHLEQMSDACFWMRAYGTTQDLVVHINATIGPCDGNPLPGGGYEQVEGSKVVADFQWDDSTMESDCHPDFATPAAERHSQIAEIINKYGVACLLQEITNVLRVGRMAEHEQVVVADLENARTKFLEGDKAYWNARIAEDYGNEP